MSPALFVLVALASPPEGPEPAAAEAPIACRVTVLEMPGLGWRRDQGDRLARIRRPGADAVWTAGREVGPALIHAAARVVDGPDGLPPNVPTQEVEEDAPPASRTEPRPEVDRGFVDTATGRPLRDPVVDTLRKSVSGRRLDQGTLVEVAIEETWQARTHKVEGEGPACTDRVPEFAHARVEGEWLIPADGILVVSLGVHTVDDDAGKAVVRERLAVIEAKPAEETTRCPVKDTSKPPGDFPPLPEDIDLAPAPHATGRAFANLDANGEVAEAGMIRSGPTSFSDRPTRNDAGASGPPTGKLIAGLGVPVATGSKEIKLADQPVALPMPPPPGRSLPRAFAPDGTPAPAPPKEDDDVKPTAGENSAEPRPTPQARPVRPTPSAPPSVAPKAKVPTGPEKPRPLTLPEAIRIGLENAPAVRVLYPGEPAGGKPTVIAPRGDDSPFRFKAEVMAMIRSIDQQYWALAQHYCERGGREVAVELGEVILRGEEAKLKAGSGSDSNVAAASKALDQFRRELAESTAGVATAERQLREVLNLKATDDSRLVPVTAPTEAKVSPDWDACLARMATCQPDILRSDLAVRMAAYRLNPESKISNFPSGLQKGPITARRVHPDDAKPEDLKLDMERQRALAVQVVHQTTHALARFYLEVDANYKQFQVARRLRATAQKRLEEQQAAYGADKVAVIDGYLIALRNWSTAVALEARYRTSYNSTIMPLEEAKGTLLSCTNVVVADLGEALSRTSDPEAKVDAETSTASLNLSSGEGASPAGHARVEAPKTFTLRLPVSPTTTVQVRVSAGWVAGAARVLGSPTK